MATNEELLGSPNSKSNIELLQEAYEPSMEDPISIQNEIHRAATRVSEYQLDSFYKETGSTQDNENSGFKRELQSIKCAIELAAHIKHTPQNEIIKLPPTMLADIANHFINLDNSLRQMRNFHEESNIEGFDGYSRDELRKEKYFLLESFYKNFATFKRVTDPLIAVTSLQEIESLRLQVNKLTDAQTKDGIEKHHDLFSKNALRHHIAAWFWLVTGSTLAIFAWYFGNLMIEKIESFNLANTANLTDVHLGLVFARIFLFGFLATLIFWSFKNYRLNKHNELLNKQKALSIQTFTEFSNAAGTDTDMRRAILSRVTSTIFDTPDMGYIKSEMGHDKEGDILNTFANIISKRE